MASYHGFINLNLTVSSASIPQNTVKETPPAKAATTVAQNALSRPQQVVTPQTAPNTYPSLQPAAADNEYIEIANLGRRIAALKDLLHNAETNPHFPSDTLAYTLKQNLGQELFNNVCAFVARCSNKGENIDEGHKILRNNFRFLLSVRNNDGLNILQQIINNYENKTLNTYTFVKAYEASLNASLLKELRNLLMNPHNSDNYILSKYREFKDKAPLLFGNLEKHVWRCCYHPQGDMEFGRHFIERNPRSLLNFISKDGKDILVQLIEHHMARVNVCKTIDELIRYKLDQKGLSEEVKKKLAALIWLHDGGRNNPHFASGYGHWDRNMLYGDARFDAQPRYVLDSGILGNYLNELKRKLESSDSVLDADLEKAKTIPNTPIDVSFENVLRNQVRKLDAKFRSVIVTAEFQNMAAVGGLATAVAGMTQELSSKPRVIMPLYEGGVLRAEVEEKIKAARERRPSKGKNDESVGRFKPEYTLSINGQGFEVIKVKHKGVRFYLIQNKELFEIPSNKNIYGGWDENHTKRRWAVFQKAAAELSMKLATKQKNPISLVHVHDSQTALIPEFIASSHPQEWREGKTPAVVATFHNNLDPNLYMGDWKNLLPSLGLTPEERNSLVKGLEAADFSTTVSPNFGKEMQTALYGNKMENAVKTAALHHKFVGILNGNDLRSFDPSNNDMLKKWKKVSNGAPLDLTFSADSPDLDKKLIAVQKEFCEFVNKHYKKDFKPEKPTVMYLGRYDSSQKGIDKLRLIMEETVKFGGQFICIGSDADVEAEKSLTDLENRAAVMRADKSVLVIRDRKINGLYEHQSKFGALARAAASVTAIPSKFEPCCLVDIENQAMSGCSVIATGTGGLADKHREYIFPRLADWDSPAQNEEIRKAAATAVHDAFLSQDALHKRPQFIQQWLPKLRERMKKAIDSTWEKPVRQLEQVYAQAIENRKYRGKEPVNLTTLKV